MQEYIQDTLRVFVVPVEIMEVPDLTIYEQMTYIVLRSYVNAQDPSAFPSYKTIADRGRMSRRQAMRCVESLVEKGLIQKETRFTVTADKQIRNTSNLYTLQAPSKRKKVVTHSHHGEIAPSDSQSPPSDSQSPPSDSQSPYHYHLTKSFKEEEDNIYLVAAAEIFKKRSEQLTKTEFWFAQYIVELEWDIAVAKKIVSKIDLSQVPAEALNKVVNEFKLRNHADEKPIYSLTDWFVASLINEKSVINARK